MIDCEIANITVEVGGLSTHFSAPAYTRPPQEVKETILQLFEVGYANGGECSLADVALFILAAASQEPRQQPEGFEVIDVEVVDGE